MLESKSVRKPQEGVLEKEVDADSMPTQSGRKKGLGLVSWGGFKSRAGEKRTAEGKRIKVQMVRHIWQHRLE